MLERKREKPRASLCGKTSRASYQQKITPSGAWWADWLENLSHCNRQGENGRVRVMCIRKSEISHGESSMLNISECHNHAEESFLWQALEACPPQKYFLSHSAKAFLASREPKRLPLLLQLRGGDDLMIARSSSAKKEAYDGLLQTSAND